MQYPDGPATPVEAPTLPPTSALVWPPALEVASVFEDAPVGISVVDVRTWKRIRVNRAFCEFLGYTEAELLALPLRAVVHPDEVDEDNRERERLQRGEVRSARRTKRYLHRSGRLLWGDFSSTLVRDADGQPSHFVSIVQDMTAQREADRRWSDAQALLQMAADVARMGAWAHEAGAVRGTLSPEAATLLGTSTAPTQSQVLERVVHQDRAMLKAHLDACLLQGTPFDVEAGVVRTDGSAAWLRLIGEPEWDEAGHVLRIRGAVQDITDTKQAQLLLRESQRAMAALLSNLPGMAFRARGLPGLPFLFASEGALALTGHPAQALMTGAPAFGDLIHPDDLPGMRARLAAALERRERFQVTYRLRTPQGEKVAWEQGCGVFHEDGSLRCIEGFVTDVTELWHARQALAELNRSLEDKVERRTAELKAANAELEAIAYSIAHDLRAPMTAIAGFAQVLEPALEKLAGREQHYLQRILANVQQMQAQTSALLSLAREAGQELMRSQVDLGEIARAHVRRLQEQEPGRPAELTVHAPLLALGDARLLRQLMTNLLENAWKFSRDRPVVRIEVGGQPDAGGGTAWFVRDHGAGFDMALAGRLFKPFARLHRANEFEGTGIGLALVHKVVQRHGGRVWAESMPGVGTTVFFTLG
jgi:hypothetical protein